MRPLSLQRAAGVIDRSMAVPGGELETPCSVPDSRVVRRTFSWAHGWFFLCLMVFAVFAQGCATVHRANPIPEILSLDAQIPGIPHARMWGDEPPRYMAIWLNWSPSEIASKFPAMYNSAHNYLAISGGGADGAFGAGLLAGWSASGDRPEFSIVTGVSTGALTAPFAFLGSVYDGQLKEVYTTSSSSDIFRKRYLLKIITGDGAAETMPLKRLIGRYITREMLAEIAAEHRRGRRLFIGTTHLDAQRPVVWSIGEIAASGHPKALELVHSILLASASIPVALQPVYIEVEAGGQRYEEMHVDGGTASQVFLFPTGTDWRRVEEKLRIKGVARAYLIRNSRLAPEFKTVKPRLVPIAGRAISSLIRTQGIGDLYRIYLNTRHDGIDYNLAYIPERFQEKSEAIFDPEYMGKLFDAGYRMAREGYPWAKSPPGFVSD